MRWGKLTHLRRWWTLVRLSWKWGVDLVRQPFAKQLVGYRGVLDGCLQALAEAGHDIPTLLQGKRLSLRSFLKLLESVWDVPGLLSDPSWTKRLLKELRFES